MPLLQNALPAKNSQYEQTTLTLSAIVGSIQGSAANDAHEKAPAIEEK
jgi:hypothetical protein